MLDVVVALIETLIEVSARVLSMMQNVVVALAETLVLFGAAAIIAINISLLVFCGTVKRFFNQMLPFRYRNRYRNMITQFYRGKIKPYLELVTATLIATAATAYFVFDNEDMWSNISNIWSGNKVTVENTDVQEVNDEAEANDSKDVKETEQPVTNTNDKTNTKTNDNTKKRNNYFWFNI